MKSGELLTSLIAIEALFRLLLIDQPINPGMTFLRFISRSRRIASEREGKYKPISTSVRTWWPIHARSYDD